MASKTFRLVGKVTASSEFGDGAVDSNKDSRNDFNRFIFLLLIIF